jgi:hypothetical protein
MIEQRENQLVLSFPTPEAARAFAQFLTTLVNLHDPGISVPPSGLFPEIPQVSQEPELSPAQLFRSRHTVLTPERQDQIFNQRQAGQGAHQRLLRAQTTLRDGVLPFSKPGSVPQPTGQPSPRQKAAAEGTFADGAPEGRALRPTVSADPVGPRRSRLRPAVSKDLLPR